MGVIRRLEPAIADKIAAGEVIERPLSVVKELLENSLDAGADFIEVEIRDGGVGLIRVKDNGRGMDAEDLRMAFERHATSKIREYQDLFRLETFGFRGEALPSIAAVAQVEMLSCTADAEVGSRIRIDGGVVQDVSPAATAPGTVIEVKNLFYNVPARRKFLKSSSHEAGLIGDLLSKYAMGHPEVRIRYVSGGQVQLDTAGLSTAEQRLAYVYGGSLETLIVPVGRQEIGSGRFLEAWLVREEVTRNNRGQEVFFVNGRLVRSAELSQALEESYYTLIAKGRFPVALLQLYLPGSELDVNVHPAKTEIKINGFEQMKPRIVEILKDALWEANITKNAFLPESVAPGAAAADRGPRRRDAAYGAGEATRPGAVSDAAGRYGAASGRETRSRERGGAGRAQPEERADAAGSGTPRPGARNAEQGTLFAPEEGRTRRAEPAPAAGTSGRGRSVPGERARTEGAAGEPLAAATDPARTVCVKEIRDLSVIGQLNNSFILAQNEEALYIIDQHTCHERILYEKFLREEREKPSYTQPLLVPVSVLLTPEQEGVLMQHIFTLRELGFVLENFGERAYLLRSLPLGLHELENVQEFFLDLLHDLGEARTVTKADILERLLITASCKGAVKANQPLSEIEMRTLLYDLSQVENAHTCPHGRPIIYKLTMAELYRIFKRGSYRG